MARKSSNVWKSAAAGAALLAAVGAAAQPNIVVILADDLGYGDVGCYGATNVLTPRIDQLAAEGLRFTDVHTPASVCTPTRYGLLTGRYAWRQAGTGVLSGVAPLAIAPGTVTLPGMLRQAGYATGGVGKWHLGLGTGSTDYNGSIQPGPLEIGFDSYFGLPATGDRVPCVYLLDHGIFQYNPADPLQISYSAKVGDEPTGSERPDLLKVQPENTQHAGTIINGISRIGWMDGVVAARWVDEDLADVLTARATNFIAAHANGPFFLYFATHDIHTPRAPHARFAGTSAHGVRGDAIQQLDWCVGEVVDALAAHGLATNTLVLFTSDNGGVIKDGYLDGTPTNQLFSGPLRGGKYSLYEGGHRAPFIARWPGRVPAGVSDAFFSLTDLLASLATLAGRPLPTDAGPDSVDVLPALLGDAAASGRTNLVMQNNGSSPLAIREGRWKYLPTAGQLYDLAADLAEATNVAAANTGVVAALNARLTAIRDTPGRSPLLAWWPLADGTGDTARDLSGYRNTALCQNGPAWTQQTGVVCLRLDGTGTFVSASGLASLADRFTAACWARSADALWRTGGALLARPQQFRLAPVAGTKQVEFRVTDATGGTRSALCDLAGLPGFDLAAWHHYAASFDSDTGGAWLYVDGVARASAYGAPGSLPADGGPFYLGAAAGGGSAVFAGDLADARVYGVALAPQRIANTASALRLDADGDGMFDDWEQQQGLDPCRAGDATEDPDGDGADNLSEFDRNTLPLVYDSDLAGALIGWWRFDETNGAAAADSSGGGHAGALSNAPAWTAGAGRQFLRFNGATQFVHVVGLSNLNQRVTAACWARSHVPNWNVAGCLMSRRPQFVLHPWLNPAGSNRLSLIVQDTGANAFSADFDLASLPGFSITNWHHYAGTYESASGAIRLYVDGMLRASTDLTPTALNSTTGALQIGKDVSYSRYFNGDIDDARLYDRALTADEIASLAAGFDDDQDGLPDEFERRIAEASGADGLAQIEDVQPGDDFDGDGFNNEEEYLAGTDPTSAADLLRIGAVYDGGGEAAFIVAISGRAGRRYVLERCAELGDDWELVDETESLAADGPLELSELAPPDNPAYYRIRARLGP